MFVRMTSPGGAQHYIYIEQQYFISDTGEGASVNRLAEAILKRVQWAIECQRTFRVFVVIPDQLEAGLNEGLLSLSFPFLMCMENAYR